MSIRQQAREALEDIQSQAERVWKCDKKVLRRSMRILAHIVNQYSSDSDKAIVQSYFDSIAGFQNVRRVIIKNA